MHLKRRPSRHCRDGLGRKEKQRAVIVVGVQLDAVDASLDDHPLPWRDALDWDLDTSLGDDARPHGDHRPGLERFPLERALGLLVIKVRREHDAS
eukprot:CAMPEP_0119057478 /NCGR_PEP_ID=MMETSP1178-20130426/1939_1 /TAXON_ID=33656 /ORGANISM="unid sp, Strain CCMP2000" /LENGTH=94 /DNA_ID=CAMNT_0007038315 /DNA_START=223 /DNA_END=507 /DNA_ORIENTATION=+